MKTLLAFVLLAITTATFGQLIKIDSSYGLNGVASIPHSRIYPFYGSAAAMRVQPDGKAVLCGVIQGSGCQTAVLRYNTNGTPDNTFGYQGVTLTIFSATSGPSDLVLQPDGKIILAGGEYATTNDKIMLVRYTTGGLLDTTFNGTGFAEFTLLDSVGENVGAVALQSNGKIVVSASYQKGALPNCLVARMNANGTLDSTFGTNGITDIPNLGLYKLVVQPDDKIVIAGDNIPGVAVMRLTANGSIDSAFGTNGFTQSGFSKLRDELYALALQADGKILAGGMGKSGTFPAKDFFGLLRLKTDGTPDSTFSNDGMLTLASNSQLGIRKDKITSVVPMPDGKILAGGVALTAERNEGIALIRFNNDGTVDNSFNGTDAAILDITDSYVGARQIALLPNGKILALQEPVRTPDKEFGVVQIVRDVNLGLLNLNSGLSSMVVYPNPIQATSTLQFELNENELLSATVTDIQGKLIATLFENKLHNAGKHTYTLGQLLPAAGTYIVQLQSKSSNLHITIVKQ